MPVLVHGKDEVYYTPAKWVVWTIEIHCKDGTVFKENGLTAQDALETAMVNAASTYVEYVEVIEKGSQHYVKAVVTSGYRH